MDLIDFLRARLDDRESDARYRLESDDQYGQSELDPEELLAEVAAKRGVVEAYERALANCRAHPDDLASSGALLALHGACKILAAAYASHPEYDQAWRPQA